MRARMSRALFVAAAIGTVGLTVVLLSGTCTAFFWGPEILRALSLGLGATMFDLAMMAIGGGIPISLGLALVFEGVTEWREAKAAETSNDGA